MKYKKYIIIICSLFLSLKFSYAQQSIDSLLVNAQNYYNEGNYNDAVDSYNTIIDRGYISYKLYYNLGNSYFKEKDYPNAILYYEKAKKIGPTNDDVNFNLNISRTKIKDKIQEVPTFFLNRWYHGFVNVFSVDTWAYITIVMFIIALIAFGIFSISSSVRYRKTSFYLGVVLGALFFISIICSFSKYHTSIEKNHAIIFQPTLTVKSSPTENGKSLFVIHEGTKVKIIDSVNDWYKIQIASGQIGWIPETTIKTI
ncbi:MAG: tetratricopeptide repeat protein [Hyphomicrobiales bacterium]